MYKILVLVSQNICDKSFMNSIRLRKFKKLISIYSENQLKTLCAKSESVSYVINTAN